MRRQKHKIWAANFLYAIHPCTHILSTTRQEQKLRPFQRLLQRVRKPTKNAMQEVHVAGYASLFMHSSCPESQYEMYSWTSRRRSCEGNRKGARRIDLQQIVCRGIGTSKAQAIQKPSNPQKLLFACIPDIHASL